MKILISGQRGLLGTALLSVLDPKKYKICTTTDANLTLQEDVEEVFQSLKPDVVIHAAAQVGGVLANSTNQKDFYYNNILMNTYMIDYACKYGVQKFISFSSVCAFADGLPSLKENLHQFGEPHSTNFAYAYSKRMMEIQMRAYKESYETKFHLIIPSNLYGENDNYHLKKSHVIPALIHKMYLAKKKSAPFEVWGDGTACREFLYGKDLARIVEMFVDQNIPDMTMIASNSQQVSMRDIVDALIEIYDFKGEVKWDISKLTGQQRRPSDNSLFKSAFPNFQFTDFKAGLKNSVDWFMENFDKARK